MEVNSLADLEVLENRIRTELGKYRLDQVLLSLCRQTKLEPFMIAGLVAFAMRYSSPRFYKKHTQPLDWIKLAPIAHLVNQYLLADPISFDKELQEEYAKSNYVFSFLRIFGNQAPYQISFFGQYARSLILYQDIPPQIAAQSNMPHFDVAGAFQLLNGVSLIDFIKVGFVVFAASLNKERFGFTRRYFEKARNQGIDIPSDNGIIMTLNQLAINSKNFKQIYSQYKQDDARFAMYQLNPLRSYPILRPFISYDTPSIDKDAFIIPLPNLILSRLSTGIFYQLFNHYKEDFSRYFGHLFEHYIGRVLQSSISPESLFSERTIRHVYGTEVGKSPDWIVIDGDTAVLIECKAARFIRLALEKGTTDAIDTSVKQIIKGLTQLSEFTMACNAQRINIDCLQRCTNFQSIIVTLEPLYLINSKPFREYIDQRLSKEGVQHISWMTLDVEQLEVLQPHIKAGINFGSIIKRLHNTSFDNIINSLHEQTGRTYKDSFLYPKEQELYQLLDVIGKF